MINKKAWEDAWETKSNGWMSHTLYRPINWFRKATFNKPWVGAGLIALLSGALGYKYGPYIDRLLSPRLGFNSDYDLDEGPSTARKVAWGTGTGVLAGLSFLGAHYDPNRKYYGLHEYAPMRMNKTASLSNYGLPIETSERMIWNNHELSPEQKGNALTLLHSFDAPPQTQITGNSLVGQAIATGLSAAKGAAVGFMTAKALGLPNPQSTAILGAMSNTLGLLPAMATSTIFGH